MVIRSLNIPSFQRLNDPNIGIINVPEGSLKGNLAVYATSSSKHCPMPDVKLFVQ